MSPDFAVLAGALAFLGLLAWDGWRRYLAHRRDHTDDRVKDLGTNINAIEADLEKLREDHEALDGGLAAKIVEHEKVISGMVMERKR